MGAVDHNETHGLHPRPGGAAGSGPQVQLQTSDLDSPPGAMGTSPSAKVEHYYPKIEGYRITGVLGQGGMGIVYRAVQTKLNRAVALKVLPAMIGKASPNAVARFRREATAAARLHHTHIVPIYDFGESHDAYYYAMELIEGQPLGSAIPFFSALKISSAAPGRVEEIIHQVTSGTSSATDMRPESVSGSKIDVGIGTSSTGRSRAYYQQVARWMADAADALQYAHGQGIIHRDIKPANLILSVDGRIMIADFGLAKSSDEASVTVTGALLGTVRYLSPEQAMAKRIPVDHRTDIYSLGATLYELLCFEPAFPGLDDKQILAAIIQRDPIPPRKILRLVPPELETICMKTLEKAPDARYETARAMVEDLRRFMNDLPIVAKRPGLVRRGMKFAKRQRAAVIGGVLASIAIIAVATTILGLRYMSGKEAYENGKALCARGDYEGAYKYLRSAVKLGYASVDDQLYLAAARSSGPTPIPLDVVLDPQVETLLADALLGFTERRWDDAESSYRRVLALDPLNVTALANLAIVKKEQYNALLPRENRTLLLEALALSTRALEMDPKRANGWNTMGVLLKMLDRFDEAIAAYGREMELRPNPYTWANLAHVNVLQRQLDKALENINKAVAKVDSKQPMSCAFLRDLAVIQLIRKDPAALTSVARSLVCKQDDARSLTVQARIRLWSGTPESVEQAFYDVSTADRLPISERGFVKRYLALACLRLSRFEDAITHAREAIALQDMSAYNNLIISIAEGQLVKGGSSDAEAHRHSSRTAFDAAVAAWPTKLQEPSDYEPSAVKGFLWFESAEELLALRAEAESLLK